jgi:type IV secretory pathway VirD2 relaxase
MRRERSGVIGRLKFLRQRALGATGAGKTKASRGAKAGRGRLRAPKTFKQRVVFKARVVKGKGKAAIHKMRDHLSYLSRSGTALNGERPEFFGKEGALTREELSQQARTWENDGHHFRFIISPERGAEIELEQYIRDVLKTMEGDLKTRLEWYAVCHYNTDNPHAHVVLRGVDDKGQLLILDRDYLSHGIRHILEHEATLRLGDRTLGAVEQGIERCLSEERFTFLDKQLLREQERSPARCVEVKALGIRAREWEKKGRLNHLKRLAFLESKGLAHEVKAGVWKLNDNLEEVLRDLAHTRRVEKLVAPHLRGTEARKQQLVIHREKHPLAAEVLGLVIAKELVDELHDKRFVLLDGSDGRTHFIPLGNFSEPLGFECRPGQLVTVAPPKASPVRAEEVIVAFLNNQPGEFSLTRFSQHVTQAEKAKTWKLPEGLTVEHYVQMFATRCETLSRAGILRELGPDRWEVPLDVVERAREYDEGRPKNLRTTIKTHTFRPLSEEVSTVGASWLDLILGEAREKPSLRGSLALQVERAIARRAEVLQERRVDISSGTFKQLLSREEQRLVRKLEHRLGQQRSLKVGEEVSGKVVGYELMGDGHRMIVRVENGFVIRKVSGKEPQLAYGTEVTLQRVAVASRGRERNFISMKRQDTGSNRGRSR